MPDRKCVVGQDAPRRIVPAAMGLKQPLGRIVEKPWGPLKGLVLDNAIKFLKVSNIDHRSGNPRHMMTPSPPRPGIYR
jgi:hypothetical protein